MIRPKNKRSLKKILSTAAILVGGGAILYHFYKNRKLDVVPTIQPKINKLSQNKLPQNILSEITTKKLKHVNLLQQINTAKGKLKQVDKTNKTNKTKQNPNNISLLEKLKNEMSRIRKSNENENDEDDEDDEDDKKWDFGKLRKLRKYKRSKHVSRKRLFNLKKKQRKSLKRRSTRKIIRKTNIK